MCSNIFIPCRDTTFMSAVELKRFCYLVHAAKEVGILQKIVKSISSFKGLLSEQNALSGETGSFLETIL